MYVDKACVHCRLMTPASALIRYAAPRQEPAKLKVGRAPVGTLVEMTLKGANLKKTLVIYLLFM